MVKSKKMSKTGIAVIVLAILLVLSMIMGMTGAWFTDNETNNTGSIAFGKVEIALDEAGEDGYFYTYRHGSSSKVTPAMPGDDLKVELNVAKAEGSQEFYFVIELDIVSVTKADGSTTIPLSNAAVAAARTALQANNTKLYCTDSTLLVEDHVYAYADMVITLDGNAFVNDFQGATVVFSYLVKAIRSKALPFEKLPELRVVQDPRDGRWWALDNYWLWVLKEAGIRRVTIEILPWTKEFLRRVRGKWDVTVINEDYKPYDY